MLISNDLFPEGLAVKILKALLPTSILATFPAHLNLLDLITLNNIIIHYLIISKTSEGILILYLFTFKHLLHSFLFIHLFS